MIENIALTRKLSAFLALSDAELSVLESLHKRRRTFFAGRDLVHQGQCDRVAYILVSGWACSCKRLRDGRRQIVDFRIPGDFPGLRSVMQQVSDHGIAPVTDIEVIEVLLSDLLDAFARTPRLAAAVWWAVSRDEAMMAEPLVNIGRRDAEGRMAHFLLELGSRLVLIGERSRATYACPLTQQLLADALGLSTVHVNRVLRDLRKAGLVTFREDVVTIGDHARLAELAAFDPTYLDQVGPLLARA